MAEPPNHYGGKSVEDFGLTASVPSSIRRAVALLPPGKRRLLYVAAAIQISLGLLDLLGIALVGLVAAVAVSGIAESQIPRWGQDFLDTLGLEGLTISQLSVFIALAAVGVLILKTAASAFMTRRIMLFLANRQAELSVSLARDFLRRPLVVIQQWTTSEAIYALGAGVTSATIALLGSAITIAAEIFLFTIVGIALFLYDPLLTLTSVVFFGLIVIILHRGLGRLSARNARIMTDASIATLTVVSEALSTYRESTVMHRRDLYIDRYGSIAQRNARTAALNAYLMEVPKYVLEVALYLGVILLAVVQFLTKDWAAAASTTALFLAAGSRVIPALLRLQGAGITVRNAAVQAQPTFFLADALNETESRDEPGPRISVREIHDSIVRGYPDFQASITVEAVTLTYPGAPERALANISLSARPGESIALVGSTGAGKSTLADVVLGVLEPDHGSVLVGNMTPKQAVQRWPGAIGYVPQAVALVIGNVRENVALGMPPEDIDDELVWEALRRAHLADYLIANREGLDTFVGERGFRLSGGQRQRLGIARALYTRPKLLVLDEATSALDSETEQAIIATLDELEGEVTTLTVAHRLATVRRADLLVYLAGGRAVAQGSFEEVRSMAPDFDRQAALLGL